MMILRTAMICGALLTSSAMAAERPLSTADITDLLPRVIAIGQDTRQTFSAAGATTYSQGGRDSYGSWWAEGDRYCSRWPPANSIACYAVLLDDTPKDGGDPILTWVGDSGAPSTNRIKPK